MSFLRSDRHGQRLEWYKSTFADNQAPYLRLLTVPLHSCAASARPPPSHSAFASTATDELDSYMYQTVGHSGLASIASALGLPLFTHEIKGKAVEMGGEYGSRSGAAAGQKSKGGLDGDETEDLYELLNKVKVSLTATRAACRFLGADLICPCLRHSPLPLLPHRSSRHDFVTRLLCPTFKGWLAAPSCQTTSGFGSSMCESLLVAGLRSKTHQRSTHRGTLTLLRDRLSLTLPNHDNQPFSCARLGLTPIAYLWERPQPELLREMVVAGMESWLVKVAGAG